MLTALNAMDARGIRSISPTRPVDPRRVSSTSDAVISGQEAGIVDEVALSAQAYALADGKVGQEEHGNQSPTPKGSGAGQSAGGDDGSDGSGELSQEEREVVDELKARDLEVRKHEGAHAAVGGAFASAPKFEYEQGPDGQSYAVGGHVQIDISEVAGDPKATIDKMRTVRAAALAPADPSAADLSVAATASEKMMAAQRELASQQIEASDKKDENSDNSNEASVDGESTEQSAASSDDLARSVSAAETGNAAQRPTESWRMQQGRARFRASASSERVGQQAQDSSISVQI